MKTRTIALTLSAIGLSACASAGSGAGSSCRSDLAASATALTEALDSAAVYDGLRDALANRSDLMLATVTSSTDDGPRGGQVIAEDLQEEEKERIRQILRSASRMIAGSDETVRVVLRDEAGIQLRRVDRFAQCAPRIRNRTTLQERISIEAAGLEIRNPMVVRIFAFVDRDGLVSDVRIDESSGNVQVDLAAARVFRGVTFTPAVIEGLLAPVWVAFPVTFTPRAPGQASP